MMGVVVVVVVDDDQRAAAGRSLSAATFSASGRTRGAALVTQREGKGGDVLIEASGSGAEAKDGAKASSGGIKRSGEPWNSGSVVVEAQWSRTRPRRPATWC